MLWTEGGDGDATVTRWEYTYSEGGTPTNVWIPIPRSNRNTESHTVTGLENGTSYTFQVRAVNDVGNGAASAASTAATPWTVPSAPVGLWAAAGNSKIGLYWVQADDTPPGRNDGFRAIDNYEYRQKTGDGDYSPWTLIIGSGPTTGSAVSASAADADFTPQPNFIVTGLTNGVTYRFQVRAVNPNGPGAASETQPVTIATEPGRPRSLTAVPGDRHVTLTWVASSDGGSPIIDWQFRQALGSGTFTADAPAWVTIPGSNADTTSYTVVSLNNAQTYKFQIRARNAIGAGNSAESDVVDPGMAPGTPTALTGTPGPTHITLSWNPPVDTDDVDGDGDSTDINDGGSPIIRYEYSQKTGSGEFGEWTAVPRDSLATGDTINTTAQKTHTVRGLTAGTAYLFRVRAVNATGAGDHVGFANNVPVYPGTKPLAPANLSASPNYDAASGVGTITLSWRSGGDGGSPITKWQYKTATTLDGLNAATSTWVDICDNTTGMDSDCAGLTSVTLPRSLPTRAPDPKDATLRGAISTGLSTVVATDDEHHFVIRALNAFFDNNDTPDDQTDDTNGGFPSGTDSARFNPTVPSAPRNVYIQSTSLNDTNLTPAGPSITLSWSASVAGGAGQVTDTAAATLNYQYSVKSGSGSYGGWVSDATPTNTTATYAVPAGTPPGTEFSFRVRATNTRGAGAHTESPSIAAGAPGSPGAGSVVEGCPKLTATPQTTQVILTFTADGQTGGTPCTTGGLDQPTGTTTLWEYSYKIGDGEWGGWLYAGEGGNFNPTLINPSLTNGAIDGLENGVAHTFRIRGLNGQLSSPILVSNPAIPGVTPPAPQGLTAAGGDRSVTLSWTSGGSGGPPITGWHYCQFVSGTTDCGATATVGEQGWIAIPRSGADTTSHTITRTNPADPATALVNGTSYTYMVRAVNAIPGFGARAQANPATPGRAPGAPPRALVDPGDGQVTIEVDVPSQTNGSPVVGYQVRKSANGGPFDAWESLGTTVRPPQTPSAASDDGAVVSGLINGVAYTFEVRAVNAYGPGAEVEAHPASVTPTGAPEANELAASPGDGQVALSWNQLSSGGSTIVKWQYRQSESGGGYGAWTDIADSGPATTSHVVTGLSNGISYAFEVRGVNVNEEMVNAEPITSAAVMPSALPPAPSVSAARGNGQVDLTWTAGTSGAAGEANYAAPTTGWQVRIDDGAWSDIADSNADTTSHTVAGLSNGTEYTLHVRAVNSQGGGAAGSASATPATTPSAPEVSAERGDGSVTLSWTAGDDGGSAVTAWHLQVDGGAWLAIAGSDTDTSSHTVTGLENGTSYTFGVRAANDVGDGAAGSASATPATTPSAPTVSATAGDGTVTVTWTAGDDGGSAVTAWHLQVNGGDWNDLSNFGLGADTRAVPVPNLENGTSYTFGVRAANDVGNGAAGTASATPATTPSAPTVTATGSPGEIEVSWTAGDDGGSAVTAWHYRMRFGAGDYGDWTAASADTSSMTFSGLDTGTGVLTYTFQVRAVNAIGEGASGTSNDAMPAMASPENGVFYSGVITGPDFCADRSLGGAHQVAYDGDGDGVADVCSLPFTRREAIARQNAVDALAVQNADAYWALVNAACALVEGEGDCGGETQADPPAVPVNDGGPYYSGIITGPNFCANRQLTLGGPATYPHDGDGDGVADVCALPYTRREGIARQIAGDTLAASNPSDFRRELASACRGLTGANYGDDPDDLARDACA